jgi:hypothetical protein
VGSFTELPWSKGRGSAASQNTPRNRSQGLTINQASNNESSEP